MHARHSLFAACIVLAAVASALLTAPAIGGDVGVSVSIGEPGFYGRIDIGDAPAPSLVYSQPIVIVKTRDLEPIYLRVPVGHASDWRAHCAEYNACGRPVYFVQDNWYNDVYAPHYRRNHGHSRGHDQGESHRRGNGHND